MGEVVDGSLLTIIKVSQYWSWYVLIGDGHVELLISLVSFMQLVHDWTSMWKTIIKY